MIHEICEAGVPTPANRIFSKKILERECNRLQGLPHSWLGELATDFYSNSFININISNISHVVSNIWMDGDKLKVDIGILDTPSGKILKSLIDEKVDVNFYMAGVGSGKVDNDGNFHVSDDYKLIQICASTKPNKSTKLDWTEIINPVKISEETEFIERFLCEI